MLDRDRREFGIRWFPYGMDEIIVCSVTGIYFYGVLFILYLLHSHSAVDDFESILTGHSTSKQLHLR